MPRFDLAVFDLDGTLIDSSPGIMKAAQETLRVLGQEEMPCEQLKSCIGPPIADTIGEIRGYSERDKAEFYGVFRPLYSSRYLMDMEVYDGVEELLSSLKSIGVKLGVATNKRVDYATRLLKDIGLSELFDSIQCMDMDGRLKKVDLIARCMADTGAEPSRTVMVGDTVSDLRAAEANHASFIAALYGYGFADDAVSLVNCGRASKVSDIFGQII